MNQVTPCTLMPMGPPTNSMAGASAAASTGAMASTRRQVPHDDHGPSSERPEMIRVPFLDREHRIGPVERLALVRPSGREELVGLAVRPVQPEAVGEDVVRIDQLAYRTGHRLEQAGVEDVGQYGHVEPAVGDEGARECGGLRIEIAVHRAG